MRVLIADNVPNVQIGLRVLLEQQPGLEVIGEVVDAEELLDCVKAACPDLLLLGWELPGLAGVDLLPALRRACPNLFVLVLSGRAEARRAALDAGADAFVSKVAPPERLLAAILSIQRIEKGNDLLSESKNSKSANDANKEKTEAYIRRPMMSELSTQANVGSKGKRGNTAIITVSVSAAVVALACIAAFIVTMILVLDAIPFHHILPH